MGVEETISLMQINNMVMALPLHFRGATALIAWNTRERNLYQFAYFSPFFSPCVLYLNVTFGGGRASGSYTLMINSLMYDLRY
jgi:hypothetical protein